MKKLEFEAEQWGLAERQVTTYLNRAGDDAWCEVWFRSKDGLKFGYRAGNQGSVFPTAEAPASPPRAKSKSKSAPKSAPADDVNPYTTDL